MSNNTILVLDRGGFSAHVSVAYTTASGLGGTTAASLAKGGSHQFDLPSGVVQIAIIAAVTDGLNADQPDPYVCAYSSDANEFQLTGTVDRAQIGPYSN